MADRSPANLLLCILTSLLLFGWAWQLWRWSIPLEGFVQTLFPSIEATSILSFQQGWGITLGLCGLLALGADFLRSQRLIYLSMGYASLSLLLVFLLLFRAKSYQWGNLIEHSIQWTLPLVFAYYRFQNHHIRSQWVLRILIAATFLGHGLYALGFYGGFPAGYLQMVHNVFGFETAGAERFLMLAGILDMITVVGLLITPLWRYALYYAIVWGFMTAMARIVAYWDVSIWLESLDIWLNQSLIRLGHGGIPLVLWLLEKQNKEQEY